MLRIAVIVCLVSAVACLSGLIVSALHWAILPNSFFQVLVFLFVTGFLSGYVILRKMMKNETQLYR